MRVYVDATEPGLIWYHLRSRLEDEGFQGFRCWLHKREGRGGKQREERRFYGSGVDYLIADAYDVPLVAVERKDLHDLARSATLEGTGGEARRIFRQLRDLRGHPLPILLLEGRPSVLYKRVELMLLGLQFWCVREGISMVYASSPRATANAIFLMARKLSDELVGPQPTDR